MLQMSLFPGTPTMGHNGGPALDEAPPAKRKTICFSQAPSVASLLKHAWGASCRVRDLDDKALVNAWAYSHAANYMQRWSIDPRGYKHRPHHHIRSQIADTDRISVIDAEMERRGLMALYELDIDLQSARAAA